MKKLKLLLAIVSTTFSFTVLSSCKKEEHLRLQRNDWEIGVKTNINSFIDKYGIDSSSYSENNYVVFDFDNTSSIFDVEEQLAIYQLKTMSFAVTPDELENCLLTDLNDINEDKSLFGYGNGSFSDWVFDIKKAYSSLCSTYGPFNADGLSESIQITLHQDPNWLEFAAKMRALYDLVYDSESSSIAYPWILYWFTGMTHNEIYELAKKSHNVFKSVETSQETWSSPSIDSKVGQVSYTWTSGIQVSENIKELWKALDDNGIDVWVCSASSIDVIKAAVDAFGLHSYCTGVLGMTTTFDSNGKATNEYDYETGVGYLANKDGSWEKGNYATKAQTQGKGKVTAIKNALYPLYNKGPIAGFMDSTGDFNFCTEFSSLKLVTCFNRANRSIEDGGGLIAIIAMHQKDFLGLDFNQINDTSDTLYLLQGRDENGLRCFRNSNCTLRFGSQEEKLFKNEDNYALLNYLKANNLTVENAINRFALKTDKNEVGNNTGLNYGFLASYDGYHSC